MRPSLAGDRPSSGLQSQRSPGEETDRVAPAPGGLFARHIGGFDFWPILVLGLLALLIVAERLYTYSEPGNGDITLYAINAHQMRDGARLYNDVWELIKPPGIMWTYEITEVLVGYGQQEFFWLGITSAIVTLGGIYRAGQLIGGKGAGLFSASLWALACSDLYLEANQPNCEALINAFSVWVLVWFLSYRRERAFWSGVLLGLLVAANSLYKQFMVVELLTLGLCLLAISPGRSERLRLVKMLALAVLSVIFAWVLVLAYLSAHQELQGFILSTSGLDRAYAGNARQTLIQAFLFHNMWPSGITYLTPLGVLAVVGFVAGCCGERRRQWILLGVFAFTAYLCLALPGKYFSHYYQLVLPPLCIGGGGAAAALSALLPARAGRYRSLPYLLGLAVLCALARTEAAYYRYTPNQWSILKYGDIFVNGRAVGEELKLNLPPGSMVYQWGEHFEIYFYSGLTPASNLPPVVLQLQNDLFPKGNSFFNFFTRRFRKDITQNRPDVVVTFVNDMLHSPNYDWLLRQYRPFPKALQQPEFTLYVRKGSGLEREMYPATPSSPAASAIPRP